MQDIANSKYRNYLGTGISFPLRIGPQGVLQLSSDELSIEESIRIILRTEPGERVYRPDFGCRLRELSFSPLNTHTMMMIRLYVQEALQRWEPRIDKVVATTDPDPIRGRIDIIVSYQVISNYDFRSLVYPFYLSAQRE